MHEINDLGVVQMMGDIQVHCAYDKMVPVLDLREHVKNRNHHSDAQIKRLAKIIRANGMRQPIVVSNRSGFIVTGHGRVRALKALGVTHVPVNYQDYESDEAEYQVLISDNSIAAWSELDLAAINVDIGDLGPFDLELLGLENFMVDVSEKSDDANSLTEDMNKKFILEITFPNDMEMMDIHDDLASRGYIVKVKTK